MLNPAANAALIENTETVDNNMIIFLFMQFSPPIAKTYFFSTLTLTKFIMTMQKKF